MSRQVEPCPSARRHCRPATGIASASAGCRPTSGANASSTTQAKRASGSRARASVSAGMWWITSPSDDVLMKSTSVMRSFELFRLRIPRH